MPAVAYFELKSMFHAERAQARPIAFLDVVEGLTDYCIDPFGFALEKRRVVEELHRITQLAA